MSFVVWKKKIEKEKNFTIYVSRVIMLYNFSLYIVNCISTKQKKLSS